MSSPIPTTQDWQWPDSLDALVAAPDHHRLLFENDHVRVLFTSVPPGATVPLHTHRWPSALYIQSWSDFVRRDESGKVLVDSRTVDSLRTPPEALWSQPLPPHTLENVGNASIDVIAVEVKGSVP